MDEKKIPLKCKQTLRVNFTCFLLQQCVSFVFNETIPCLFLSTLPHLYRKQPSGHLQHRGSAEIVGEEFYVDGGRHEDETQVGAFSHQRTQDPQQEVTVKVPLVHLIHNHHLVLSECPVLLDLSQQESLCQEQKLGSCGAGCLKAYLMPHLQYIQTSFVVVNSQ